MKSKWFLLLLLFGCGPNERMTVSVYRDVPVKIGDTLNHHGYWYRVIRIAGIPIYRGQQTVECQLERPDEK